MITWDLRRLQMHLQKGGVPHEIYLLLGDDYYLMSEAIACIKSSALNSGAADFNYDQYFAGDVEVSKVRDAVEMLPMMSSRRLVILRNAHLLKDRDWDALSPILEQIVDTTTFVIAADKLDKRKKYYKKIIEKSVVVELDRPYENQLAPWVEYIVSQFELSIQVEASALLRQLVGASLSEIHNQVSKLRDYLGERKVIEVNDVLEVVPRSRTDQVFELTNAIGRKDRALALQTLAQLLDYGQSELGVTALIARHIRILGVVKQGMNQGASAAKICSLAGIPNFFLKDYQLQAKSWTEVQLQNVVHVLKDTDKALKSSPVSSSIWLENFVLKVCSL